MLQTPERILFHTALACCCVLFLACWAVPAHSESVADDLKQVDKALRSAERAMFNGKRDQSIAALENIQTLLVQVQQADPDNPKLKQAENKYQKLVKDLERRTGKDLGGGSLTAAAASTATTLPELAVVKPVTSATAASGSEPEAAATSPLTPGAAVQAQPPAAAKLPYEARRPFDKATRGMENIESLFEQYDTTTDSSRKGQLVSRIETSINTIQSNLDEARQLAASKDITSHPSFDGAEAQLVLIRQRVAQAASAFAGEQAVAQEQTRQIETDVQTLKEEYDRLNSIIGAATGTVIYYNDLEPVYKLMDQIKDFEAHDQAALERLTGNFADQYGSTQSAIDQKAANMGYVGAYYSASYHYLQLAATLDNISKTRRVMAEDLARKAEQIIQRTGSSHDFSRLTQYEKAQEYLTLARQFDAGNQVVLNLSHTIEDQIGSGMEQFGEKIDAQKWPGNGSDAPGNTDNLVKAAKQWFEQSPDWGSRAEDPYTILAVAVTGPWSVQKRNILDEVTMYGLPVLLAVQKESDRKNNIARVFSLTLRTREERAVKMEPPFDYATVGSSYYIRPKAL